MRKFLKQLFCFHRTIDIKTQSDVNGSLLIVTTHITRSMRELKESL
jgi:hypothetical protein